jgi:hypothetical protein
LKSFEGIGSSEACMYYHRAEYIYIYICAADIIVFFLHDKKKGTRTGNRHFPNTVLSPLHCIFVAKKEKWNCSDNLVFPIKKFGSLLLRYITFYSLLSPSTLVWWIKYPACDDPVIPSSFDLQWPMKTIQLRGWDECLMNDGNTMILRRLSARKRVKCFWFHQNLEQSQKTQFSCFSKWRTHVKFPPPFFLYLLMPSASLCH